MPSNVALIGPGVGETVGIGDAVGLGEGAAERGSRRRGRGSTGRSRIVAPDDRPSHGRGDRYGQEGEDRAEGQAR